MEKPTTFPPFGKKIKIEDEQTFSYVLGNFTLRIQRHSSGLNISYDTGIHPNDGQDSYDKNMQTFIFENTSEFAILPALPDLPVRIKTKVPTHILPGNTACFYLIIPINLQIYSYSEKKENLLTEISIKQLISTWLGTPDLGEPAYALNSEIFDKIPDFSSLTQALCQLEIENNSDKLIELGRFVIRTEQMDMYKGDNYLLTARVFMQNRGVEAQPIVSYRHPLQNIDGNVKLIQHARFPENSNLLKKSFYFIKSLTQY